MLPITSTLYSKYSYFLHVLSDDRLNLFIKNQNVLDHERFFDSYDFVIYYHWKIKLEWKRFLDNRRQIIKKFEFGKHYILLRSHFCHDIIVLVISYIL